MSSSGMLIVYVSWNASYADVLMQGEMKTAAAQYLVFSSRRCETYNQLHVLQKNTG